MTHSAHSAHALEARRESAESKSRRTCLIIRQRRSEMQRTAIGSSNIRSIGYDDATSQLEVEYDIQSVHRYREVPPALYHALTSALAEGSRLAAQIEGQYPHVRMM